MSEDRIQVFLSYARKDDVGDPDDPKSKGIVTALHDLLEHLLSERGESAPKIWRDKREIEKADYFDPLIQDGIQNSQLFVVALSPNWLNRPYCRKELELFLHRWGNIRERIIVVRLNVLEDSDTPDIFKRTEGFELFGFDGKHREAGYEQRFHWLGKVRDERFHQVAFDLAGHLYRRSIYHQKHLETAPAFSAVESNGRTVYLAKPAPDMVKSYEFLANNLIGLGFNIVPKPHEFIPPDRIASSFIDGALDIADTSVHILGNEAGYAPEGQDCIVKLQLARAAEKLSQQTQGRSSSRPFRRIVWAPKLTDDAVGLEFRDALDVLKKFGAYVDGDEVLNDGQSKFWGALRQFLDRPDPVDHLRLDRSAPAKQAMDATGMSESRIYICHKEEDYDFATNIADVLRAKGAVIDLPGFQGTEVERTQLHKEYLRDCDSVVLCWARATDVWAKMSLNEFRDWRKLGRTDRFRSRSLVLGPPPGRSKAPSARPSRSDFDQLLDLVNEEGPNPELLLTLLNAESPSAS